MAGHSKSLLHQSMCISLRETGRQGLVREGVIIAALPIVPVSTPGCSNTESLSFAVLGISSDGRQVDGVRESRTRLTAYWDSYGSI